MFSGKREDFVMWQAKILAYANFKEFKDVLLSKKNLIKAKDGAVLTADEVKTNAETKKENSMAYSMLNLCVRDAVSFTAVFHAKSDEYPEGYAGKAWSNLQTIYKPLSTAKKHELEQQFHKSSLDREHTNPDEW